MPLSPPAKRQLYHNRQIICQGFFREDGLWDIEALVIDTKNYAMSFYDGRHLPANNPLHEMHLRITLNNQYQILQAEAATEHAPFPACPEIASAYHQLIGLTIGPGFNRKVRELFKGCKGCTHITELLAPMATVAFQTISSGLRQHEAAKSLNGQQVGTQSKQLARLINTCHGWDSQGAAVRAQFPDHYTGKA